MQENVTKFCLNFSLPCVALGILRMEGNLHTTVESELGIITRNGMNINGDITYHPKELRRADRFRGIYDTPPPFYEEW